MMKKLLISLILCVMLPVAVSAKSSSSGQSGSSSKNMGAGGWIQAGNPGEHAGLDFMMRMGNDITLDIYAHLYLSDDDNSFGAYVGYYWNFYLNNPKELGRMGFYVGPTGGIGLWDEEYWVDYKDHNDRWWWRDEFGFAIRAGVTGGFQWEFPVIPLQLYFELSPVVEFHYLSWEDDHDWNNGKHEYYDDDDVEWKFPDFFFRVGLRFWF
ncbi:MAG: hypothetical protein MJZ25_01395 [Fibrobacter sp.]|nr:hypothetical protein [Fibrobacter sp.]